MFTRLTEKQCRAKKKDGTYSNFITCYRLVMTPINNWDLPILLERKRIKEFYNNEGYYLNIRNIN